MEAGKLQTEAVAKRKLLEQLNELSFRIIRWIDKDPIFQRHIERMVNYKPVIHQMMTVNDRLNTS